MSRLENQASGKDERLLRTELAISSVLRHGVILCGTVIAIGLLGRQLGWGAVEESSAAVVHELLGGEKVGTFQPVSDLAAFWQGIRHFSPDVWMEAGLVLLIALPIARVGLTVVLFFLEGDWVFFGITLTVLAVLLLGVMLGHGL